MTKDTLIEHLNNDLEYEYSAIIQYISYAATVKGPFRPELSKFFLDEVTDEQQHAKLLADKIVALGGQPSTSAKPVPSATEAKEMLIEVMNAERKAIEAYSNRAKEAKELGLTSLSLELEDMIRDEANHLEEVEKILSGWGSDS